MKISGNLLKMRSELQDEVQYYLPLSKEELHLNKYIGSEISLTYTGTINCVKCGRETNKSFSQGFCYPCFQSAPETEECVLRPELCQAHEGIARDMEFAEKHCLIDHYVYLSLTSGVKVGVTRNTQIPTRWIDQGAIQAIKFAKTPNRYTAGLIEVALKNVMADKTNWRNMLKGVTTEDIDLIQEKEKAVNELPAELKDFVTYDNSIQTINFPVKRYPEKVVSLNLDKTPLINGTLTGIKGQYLYFDGTQVINIRKFGGYFVEVNYSIDR